MNGHGSSNGVRAQQTERRFRRTPCCTKRYRARARVSAANAKIFGIALDAAAFVRHVPGFPTNLAVNKSATALASYAYTLDAAGHRLSVSELSGRTVNYGYDSLYRLTSETIAS